MTNWSSLSGHRNNVMIPTSGAQNGANGQPFPSDDIQLNSSSSMLIGGKKINQKAKGKGKGKGKGIKKQCRLRLTGESSNLGKESLEEHKTVEQTWKNLTDQINRRMTRVKGKYWDWLRNCPKVLATVSQIEKKWPLLSNLQKIKENMKNIMAEFRAGSLMEVEAKQKLIEVKKELNHIDLQLQELNKTGNLDMMFVNNLEYSTETLGKELFSAEPCLKEIYATDDDASLPPLEAFSPSCFSFLLENTVPLGELQVLGNFSEDEGQDTKINDVIPVDQDHGSFLAREMLKRDYSSWQIKFFNEDNKKVDVAGFPGLEQALQEADCSGIPGYLKPIAAQIEIARGKATEFPHKSFEVLICATIKEMEEWCTPKDSGWGQLKKWAATLNMGKQFGFEVKFADNMLENISLACFAYSMIFEGG